MIHTEALTRSFGSGKQTVEAVRGIDLDVAEGELVALLGPNGAGKSTTLRMLTSLLPPTSGTARVAGLDVAADPAAVRARIGYIGQKDGAGPQLPGLGRAAHAGPVLRPGQAHRGRPRRRAAGHAWTWTGCGCAR